MKSTIIQEVHFNASAKSFYDAYMNPRIHSSITSSKVEIDPQIGGKMTAYDNYISGEFLELVKNKLIKQTWKAEEEKWTQKDYSILQLEIVDRKDSCVVKMHHSNIPPNLVSSFEDGWKEHYWNLFIDYFNKK